MARILVRDVMTSVKDCAVVKPEDTISTLKQELRVKSVRMAIVVNSGDNRVEGVITVSDLKMADDFDYVSDHWNRPPYTISPDRPISVARALMDENGSHQLTVINENEEPLGVIWDYIAILGNNSDDG